MRRVTIKDVAREAGVSVSAVSRVFTKGASASAKTRDKVLVAADRLGYRPSLLARGLVSERTNLITLVIGRMTDPFDAEFLDCFARTLAARGVRLLFASPALDATEDSGLLQALDYQSDAVVVAAGTVSKEHYEICLRAGLPVVLLGRIIDHPGVDAVLADNVDAGRQAAELLLRTGCRSLAFFGLGGTTFSDRERYAGFRDVVLRAGARLSSQAVDPQDPEAMFQAASDKLSSADPPDGIFCARDVIAISVLEAARALHFPVPEAVSVIGFNNTAISASRSFRLTTVDYPVEPTVNAILEVLDERFADPKSPSRIRHIPTRLIVRATTREQPTTG